MKPIAVIPNMITLGNAVCGFAALVKIGHGDFLAAAWLILLAMVFDAFDGKVARLTKQTSAFGAQLDSLSDAISFGVAPALLVALMMDEVIGPAPASHVLPKAVWFFCLAFALCAILRLARFNVAESKGEEDHQIFHGLPSPAAAGLVASLVVLKYFLAEGIGMEELGRKIVPAELGQRMGALIVFPVLPASTLLLGYLMISSRIRYAHVVSQYLSGKRTFEYFAYLVFVVFLAAAMREVALVVGFGVYAASGPVAYAFRDRRAADPDADADEEKEDIPLRPAPADSPGGSREEP